MSRRDTVTILENKLQTLIEEKNILSISHKNIIEDLRIHLELMGEIDDRRINKLYMINDISDAEKITLEVWFKKFFHISDDELRTDDQKKRFDLDLRRAQITSQIIDVDNEFAETNQRLKIVDSTREFIGMGDWDPTTLKAYGMIASLERKIRRWIDQIYSNEMPKYWRDDNFITTLTKDRYEVINSKYNDFVAESSAENYPLIQMDFVDFSDYEKILESTKGQLNAKKHFFKGGSELQGSMITYLRDLRELRNQVMHRPPLNSQQNNELEILYSKIMKIINNK